MKKNTRSLNRAAEKDINAFLDAYTRELMASLEEHHGFTYTKAQRATIMSTKFSAATKPAKKKPAR